MRNKRGSHVGMILSFLIFVTFLGFLYTVIEPATRSAEDKLDLMAYLEVELLKEFSADMSSLILEVPTSTGCIQFDLPDDGLEDWGIVAKDINNIPYNTFTDPTKSVVDFGNGGILKLYYSPEFEFMGSERSCDEIIEGTDFNISLFKTTKELFESRILNLSDYLDDAENYEDLKDKLNIGVGDEFGFKFNDENKEFVAGTEDKNVSTDVFVEEIPIQYINNKANIKSGFLNIKVW